MSSPYLQLARYGHRTFGRRLGRALPWVGAAIAILTVASAMRRKGVIGGAIDTALNAIPFVGGAKYAAETIRGRDFIRDRPKRVAG
jgi:hypothetical protein